MKEGRIEYLPTPMGPDLLCLCTDFARTVGEVAYTDVWFDNGDKFGTIEYRNEEDFQTALKTLDNQTLDGARVKLVPVHNRILEYSLIDL